MKHNDPRALAIRESIAYIVLLQSKGDAVKLLKEWEEDESLTDLELIALKVSKTIATALTVTTYNRVQAMMETYFCKYVPKYMFEGAVAEARGAINYHLLSWVNTERTMGELAKHIRKFRHPRNTVSK